MDPDGILAWNTGCYERTGRDRSHVIEALTEKVSSGYLAYLRAQGVSYVIAGKEHLDCALLLQKLKTLFGIEHIILAGGGCINGIKINEDGNIIGKIVNISVDEAVMTAGGKVDAAKLHAISYDPCSNTYIEMGEAAGKAFSDGNKLK